jgi:hypothetical protein
MLSIMEEAPVTLPQLQSKPYLVSHDSLEECSLEHLVGVRQLVEKEFLLYFEVPEWETPAGSA